VIIYKTLIKPVLMYGAETWFLSKADVLRYVTLLYVTSWGFGEKNIKKNLRTYLLGGNMEIKI
jgi:hypothetical protein